MALDIQELHVPGRLFSYRVDGLVVTTNVDPAFLAGLPSGGRPFLERLAREHGRRLPDGGQEAS